MTTQDQPTVLIVEDEPDLAELYVDWLDDEYDVRTASSGEDALVEFDGAIDVVLLDRRLPGLSGAACLSRLRSQGVEARVAMVTAVKPDFDIIGMGFDDYLNKPVQRSELKATIDRLLELAAYDDITQEYFRLASKLATLETAKDSADLETNDEYLQLRDRYLRVQQEAQTHLDMVFDAEDEGIGLSQVFRIPTDTPLKQSGATGNNG